MTPISLKDLVLCWMRDNKYPYEFVDIYCDAYVFRIPRTRKRIAILESVVWMSDDWEDSFLGYFRLKSQVMATDPNFFKIIQNYLDEPGDSI